MDAKQLMVSSIDGIERRWKKETAKNQALKNSSHGRQKWWAHCPIERLTNSFFIPAGWQHVSFDFSSLVFRCDYVTLIRLRQRESALASRHRTTLINRIMEVFAITSKRGRWPTTCFKPQHMSLLFKITCEILLDLSQHPRRYLLKL